MSLLKRVAGSMVLSAAIAAGGSVVLAGTPQEAGVQVRVYDAGHKDYHNWDDREDHAYRRYLKERHEEYRAYSKQKEKEQREYWEWRHSHPD